MPDCVVCWSDRINSWILDHQRSKVEILQCLHRVIYKVLRASQTAFVEFLRLRSSALMMVLGFLGSAEVLVVTWTSMAHHGPRTFYTSVLWVLPIILLVVWDSDLRRLRERSSTPAINILPLL